MLALILGLSLASGVQSAPPISGVVAGTVLDATGAAISGATVRLEVAGTPVNEMQTATDGRFSFRSDVGSAGAGAGAVRVIVSAAGFASATVDVDRAAGE